MNKYAVLKYLFLHPLFLANFIIAYLPEWLFFILYLKNEINLKQLIFLILVRIFAKSYIESKPLSKNATIEFFKKVLSSFFSAVFSLLALLMIFTLAILAKYKLMILTIIIFITFTLLKSEISISQGLKIILINLVWILPLLNPNGIVLTLSVLIFFTVSVIHYSKKMEIAI
ncbi:hypothetical protein OWM07_06660 [Deferribacter thermophilus]|uniref:hypothetical protein n=1 Tax=Deferribacter thermophilus TaxID=53573 RepID=UPI003C1BA6B3